MVIRRTWTAGLAAWWVLSVWLASCGGGGHPGATQSETIGASGGALVIVGSVTVTVPPSALVVDTTLTVTELPRATPPVGYASVGTPLSLTPKNQTFPVSVPIALAVGNLPAGRAITDVLVLRGDFDTGVFVPLPSLPSGPATVVAMTDTFGDFAAVVLADPRVNPLGTCGDSACVGAESCSSCPHDCGLCFSGVSDGGVVGSSDRAHTLAAYHDSACVVAGARVACWGSNGYQQLGAMGTFTVPVAVTLAGPAVAVGVAESGACAVLASGAVSCWGTDIYDLLAGAAPGATGGVAAPTLVPGITDAVDIVGNWYNFCVRHAAGAVSCWGDNAYGVLPGATVPSETPVAIAGIADAVEIEAADWNIVGYCARHATGRVTCWGKQLVAPVDMGLVGVTELEGVGNGFCALTSAGWSCWGTRVVDVTTGVGTAQTTPTVMPAYATFTVLGGAMQSGSETLCAVEGTQTVCAGIAVPSITSTSTSFPGVLFRRLTNAGWSMVCGITPAGVAQCFGDDVNYQLGNDAIQAASGTPVNVLLPF